MDTNALKEGLGAVGVAIATLKNLKDLLPSGQKRDEADKLLHDAESKMKEAEAKLAKELGFPICERCWPPEVMTRNAEDEFVCRKCGKPSVYDEMPIGLG